MVAQHIFSGKRVLIIGYALTGKSVANYLSEAGAILTITDQGKLDEDPSIQAFVDNGVTVIDGGHPLSILDEPFDMIIKNPGIPYDVPIIQLAIERHIPIYTDVELAYRISDAPIIGITGSNGKTTTTSLVQALISERKEGAAYLAGNIGVPALEVAQQATTCDDIVMELSSFQLEGIEEFHPEIAVICNIYSSHLDYHKTRDNYIAAKMKITQNQNEDDYLIYRYDAGELHQLVQASRAQKIPFSLTHVDDYVRSTGMYVEAGKIYYQGEFVMNTCHISIPGEHNIENVLAAIAVAKIRGIENQQIQTVTTNYQGMLHRIQHVMTSNNRAFYNDSKATNITATVTAMKSFDRPIRYIGGGLDRGNGFEELVPFLSNVTGAYLYGQTKEKMAEAFAQACVPDVQLFDNLEFATQAAYRDSLPGEVVLFSPCCASWDQFKNFEERGDLFMKLIRDLVEAEE